MSKVRVFLNPRAAYGTGRERWARIEPELGRRLGAHTVDEVDPERLPTALEGAVGRGERRFVAAGGDGAVNLLVNAAMALPEAEELTIGAVGLGSSNDFHKRNGVSDEIAGIPVRVDFEKAEPCDVIAIEFAAAERPSTIGAVREITDESDAPEVVSESAGLEKEAGSGRLRYAIVNASIGVTAEANARFNDPTGAIRAARRISVDAAISMSVLTTLCTWRDLTCSLSLDGEEPLMASVTNLGVFKNPHFGGALRYDINVGGSDGRLGVALCEGLSRAEVVAMLRSLRRGRFAGRPKTRSWTPGTVAVAADRSFALEADGEVLRAKSARFSVAPARLRCCT
jgi:diacylglycerol kinase family enzyme